MIVEAILPKADKHLKIISDKAQLTEAAARMGDGNTNLIVVCDDSGTMVGVVSKTDIVSRIGQCQGAACTTMVASVMSREVACCRPGDPLEHVWEVMKGKGFFHIPVINHDGKPLGVITAHDALQVLLVEVEHEESLLRDYVMGMGYH